MTPSDEFLIRLIVDRGLLVDTDLETLKELDLKAAENGGPLRLMDVLIDRELVSRDSLAELVETEFGMELVDLEALRIPGTAVETVPRELAEKYHVFPVTSAAGKLRLAVSDPLDVDSVDSIRYVLGREIEACLATYEDIRVAILRYYGVGDRAVEAVISEMAETEIVVDGPGANAPGRSESSELEKESDAPIIRLVQIIIQEAFRRRASDIHLEPLEKRFRVRFRIDGVLHEVESPPKRLQPAIISRLKIMANLSIAEKRQPQDGRIQLILGGRPVDLRVSSMPTVHGESIVMRILDKEGLMLGLPELGFFSDDQATFEKLISLPDGIVLVTGPTGSGKTTTLYGCLNYINQPDRKIITVEDPVEYQLNGINQVPVRSEIGMTFSSALRSILRQAPNVIMIGEIRDLQTAEIAINASLTGHMVFSTLHTNDAPGAVTRLIDLGVKPFLVATSLRAVMAQRLVRRVCPKCARPYVPEESELMAAGLAGTPVSSLQFVRGQGCPHCGVTGYRGRMGIFEIFLVGEELQRMIFQAATAFQLRDKARSLGMRSMREDGLRKVLAGSTTLDEVLSATVDETG